MQPSNCADGVQPTSCGPFHTRNSEAQCKAPISLHTPTRPLPHSLTVPTAPTRPHAFLQASPVSVGYSQQLPTHMHCAACIHIPYMHNRPPISHRLEPVAHQQHSQQPIHANTVTRHRNVSWKTVNPQPPQLLPHAQHMFAGCVRRLIHMQDCIGVAQHTGYALHRSPSTGHALQRTDADP